MATTPGNRRREARTDLTGDDRDPVNPILTPMQEPLGSMDRPGSRTSDVNEVNLGPGEAVRRTGNLGATQSPQGALAERSGRGFTATFALVAVILLLAVLAAVYVGNNRTTIATGDGTVEAPVADGNSGTGASDTTGSTTTPPPPAAPGSGGANNSNTGTETVTPPANP